MTETIFPPSPRYFYEKAPLVQVVGQLSFPVILRIQSEVPSAFQERIRASFPLFEQGQPQILGQQLVPPEVMQFIVSQNNLASYQFLTEDRSYALSLTPNGMGLTTTKYTRWEEFSRLLQEPLNALLDIYKPSFFTRVGLRYINAIQRKKLALAATPWRDLLRAEIVGELSSPEFEAHSTVVRKTLLLKLASGHSIILNHGLANVRGDAELAYLLDFDLFAEPKTETDSAKPTLDQFHTRASHAFRWCISDRLHDALGPIALD